MPPNPSLFNLVAASHNQHLFEQSIDVLSILSQALEQTLLSQGIKAHLYIGMQTFSAFELYAAHYGELAQQCERITVFGEADVRPRQVANTDFIALPPDATLSKERFIIVNHAEWQVMFLAQELANTSDRYERLRRYKGLLTFAPNVVERCSTVAAMLAGEAPTPVGRRNNAAQQASIAQFAMRLALTLNRPGVKVNEILGEIPSVIDMAQQIISGPSLSARLGTLFQQARKQVPVSEMTLYMTEGSMLRPTASTSSIERLKGIVLGQEAMGQAAARRTPSLLKPAEAAAFALQPNNQGLYVAPLLDQTGQAIMGLLTYELSQPWADEMENMPFSALTGLCRALLLHDRGGFTANSNGQTANSEDAAPQRHAITVKPKPSTGLLKPPSTPPPPVVGKGRIRLGPRRSAQDEPTISAPNVEIARLPEVKPVPVEETPYADYQRRMISYLLSFDRDGADRVWREAYTRFPARELCVNLLQPVLIAVGEGWHRGQVSVAAEHFTTSYVESKLVSFLSSYPDNPNGAVILTGCAQGETHETGIMMLSLFMRWDGHKVIYLGANVPNSTLEDALREIKPDMLCLSATMKENANNMTEVGHIIAKLPDPRPLFGFGGTAFIFFPDMRQVVPGHYLGDDPETILTSIRQLVASRRQTLR